LAAVQRSVGVSVGKPYVKQVMRTAERLTDEALNDWLGPDPSGRRDEEKAMVKAAPWLAPTEDSLNYDPDTWERVWQPVLIRVMGAIKLYLAGDRQPIMREGLVYLAPPAPAASTRARKRERSI
jgi:hypothetical protein